MRPRTYLYAIWRDLDALAHQSISFFEEGLRIDDHAVAQHARLSLVHNAGRQQMEDEGLIADLNRVTGVVAALIADLYVEPLGKQIYNLALSFITPLGADDSNNHK